MKKLLAVILLSVLPVAACFARPFTAHGVTLEIPDGFNGPMVENADGARVYGFTQHASAPGTKTVLQMSVYDFGKNLPPDLSPKVLMDGSKRYLLQFLKGVERRRTGFSQSDLVSMSLGGIPASKIAWKGDLQGRPTNGVMYCLIAGSTVISLHTQDSGNHVTPGMQQAIHAIEALAVAGKPVESAPVKRPSRSASHPSALECLRFKDFAEIRTCAEKYR